MTYATAVNMTNLTGIFTYGNTVTQGWFGPMILISLFLVCVLSLGVVWGLRKSVPISAFLSFIIGSFLRTAGVLQTDWWILLNAIVLILGMFWLWFGND